MGQINTNKKTMESLLEQNKAIVLRFNKEFIEQGNMQSFKELVADNVINHSAPAGTPAGPESMSYFILEILRKGFPDLTVEIFDQIAEGDKVTTRKALHATHTGEFMGISATNKKVTINVIDIIKLRDGKYVEHWGISNIPDIIKMLSEK
jgi:predicted ester cyclase